jgi:hypothetical protein
MKAVLLTSNNGNHQGFNRTYSLEFFDSVKEARKIEKQIKNSGELEELQFTMIITTKTIDHYGAYVFTGGSCGYIPALVKHYFNYKY